VLDLLLADFVAAEREVRLRLLLEPSADVFANKHDEQREETRS
jgi:hypothetical protein